MIAEDSHEGHWKLDDGSSHLVNGRLAIRDVVVQLISGKNHKVWSLNIQNLSNEVYRKWVGLTLWQKNSVGINSIFAKPGAGDHVGVRDLDDLEPAILSNS